MINVWETESESYGQATSIAREEDRAGSAMERLIQAPYDATVRLMLVLLEQSLLPDLVIRKLTRLLLASRLRSGYQSSSELQLSQLIDFAHCETSTLQDKFKRHIYEKPEISLSLKENMPSGELHCRFSYSY